jgi:hypothetical protein
MATTKPLPRIFPPRAAASRYALNTNARFHAIASKVDGYHRIVELSRRLDAWEGADGGAEASDDVALAAIIDGSDIDTVAVENLAARERDEQRRHAGYLVDRVRTVHVEQMADSLLSSPELHAAFIAATRDDYESITAEAAETSARLGPVRTFEQLQRSPQLADDLVRFTALAEELHEAYTTLAEVLQIPASYWPRSDLYESYATAWPRLYLRRPFAVLGGRVDVDALHGSADGNSVRTQLFEIAPETPPWHGLDAAAHLHWVIDHGITLWCPTAEQLRDKQAEINADAEKAGDDRSAQEEAILRSQQQTIPVYTRDGNGNQV